MSKMSTKYVLGIDFSVVKRTRDITIYLL